MSRCQKIHRIIYALKILDLHTENSNPFFAYFDGLTLYSC